MYHDFARAHGGTPLQEEIDFGVVLQGLVSVPVRITF